MEDAGIEPACCECELRTGYQKHPPKFKGSPMLHMALGGLFSCNTKLCEFIFCTPTFNYKISTSCGKMMCIF